jgi:hypothetical protein
VGFALIRAIADKRFVDLCGLDVEGPVRGLADVAVYDTVDEISFAELAKQPFSLFVSEELDAVLDRMMDAGAYGFHMLAAGTPNPAVLNWAIRGPDLSARRCRQWRAVATYEQKESALLDLEGALFAAGVADSFVRSIVMAADECLLNAIFDANPDLEDVVRTDSFAVDPAVGISWQVTDGLAVVSVRDAYGRFKREDFGASVVHRFIDAGLRDGPGMSIGIATMVRNCSGVFVEVDRGRSTIVHLVTDTTTRFSKFVTGGRVMQFREGTM